MRHASLEAEFALDPTERPLGRRGELEEAKSPDIAHRQTAEMSEEARVGNQCGDAHSKEERHRPRGDVVCADDKVGVHLIRADRLDAEQQEHPDAGVELADKSGYTDINGFLTWLPRQGCLPSGYTTR